MILNFLIYLLVSYLVLINLPNMFTPFAVWFIKKISIGKKVYKKSGELFQSGKEFNIIKNVVLLYTDNQDIPFLAFKFEDEEIIPIGQCKFKGKDT